MIRARGSVVLLLIVLVFFLSESSRAFGKVHVVVMNELGGGRTMNIHCRSRDNDLGHLAVPDGFEINWKFSVNIWHTTLFYCDVQWDGSERHGFHAYSYHRDFDRCRRECVWKIARDGLLYNYDGELGSWGLVPFQDGR